MTVNSPTTCSQQSTPSGRAKVRLFFGLGFQRESIGILSEALRRHAEENNVATSEETDFGSKYVVEGPLVAPEGKGV